MFITHCHDCDAQHLLTNRHILSMHRTSEGWIGYVRCASGHVVVHDFTNGQPVGGPSASQHEPCNDSWSTAA